MSDVRDESRDPRWLSCGSLEGISENFDDKQQQDEVQIETDAHTVSLEVQQVEKTLDGFGMVGAAQMG
jgi:hypothetical protein